MAKLYAELSSDKGGRVASKGGNQDIRIKVYSGNLHVATMRFAATSEKNTILSISKHLAGHEIIVQNS